MHNIKYYECLLPTGWIVTVLVLRRVKNIIKIVELLQRWYHENSWEFTGSYWAHKGHPASSQGDHRD
jgi:hypothetical protein